MTNIDVTISSGKNIDVNPESISSATLIFEEGQDTVDAKGQDTSNVIFKIYNIENIE